MSEDIHAECREALARSQAETRAAFENRAQMYYYIFEEMAREIGRQRAAEIMRMAIYARGVETGRKYHEAAAAGDFAEIGRLFVEGSPAEGQLFLPGIEETGEDRVVLSMEGCPLVDAWRELGLPPDEVDLMCEIAAAVDYGTFEGAGLDLTFRERAAQPGAHRCVLELRAKR